MNIPLDNILMLDIETVVIEPDFDRLSSKKQKGWKLDPGEYAARAVFHAEYSKIVCVSMMVADKAVSFCGDDEANILMQVRGVMNNAMKESMTLGGFAIDRFDIPFMFKRSYISGVQPSPMVMYWDKKPWEVKTYDLMKMWSNSAWDQTVSLAVLAECLGVSHGKDDTDGSDVKDMYRDRDFESIKRYCESDVRLVRDCMVKLNSAKTEPDSLGKPAASYGYV
jgi:3'-5' exonuclease